MQMLLHLFHQQNFWLNEIWFFTPFIQFLPFDFLIAIFLSVLLRKWLPFTGTWFISRGWTRNLGNSLGKQWQHQERESQPEEEVTTAAYVAAPAPGSKCCAPSYHPAVGTQTASAMGSEINCFPNLPLETWSSNSRNSFSVNSVESVEKLKSTHALISIWKVHFVVFSQTRHQACGKTNFKGKPEQINTPSKTSNWQKLFKHYKQKRKCLQSQFPNCISCSIYPSGYTNGIKLMRIKILKYRRSLLSNGI